MRAHLAVVLTLALATPALAQRTIATVDAPTSQPLRGGTVCNNGRQLVVIANDHHLHVWDLASGVHQEIDPKLRVSDVNCSKDGQHVVASAARDSVVILIDVRHPDQRKVFKITEHLADGVPQLSADGQRLLAVSDDLPVTIIDLPSGRMTRTKTDFGNSGAVAWSPDQKRFATADVDTHVRIYEADGRPIATADNGELEPLSVEFSGDGKRVVAGGGDSVIRTFDATTGKLLATSEKLPGVPMSMLRSGDTISVVCLDSAALAPMAVYEFSPATNRAVRREIDLKGVLGAGPIDSGWAVIRSDGKSVTVSEMARVKME